MSKLNKFLTISGLLVLLVAATAIFSQAQTEQPTVTVYKSPTCGCCTKWVTHLEENGFKTVVQDMPDVTPIKTRYGVPARLSSCHTAVVDGYVVEGHVPADVIKDMLKEKPEVAGLAVPGMPIGSPGMEVPGRDAEAYDILSFTKEGSQSVYASR